MTAARILSVGVALVCLAPRARAQTPAASPAAEGLVWRTPGGALTLAPGGRLQVDGAFFPKQTPKSGLFIRRAQIALRGWVGDSFYFDLGGEFAPGPPAGAEVAPSVLPAADDFLAYAPLGDTLIVQVGQFDVPFTLANQTPDTDTDFIERPMAARTLGAPRNKDVGAMAHGLLAGGLVSYAVGLFDGEGPGFRNADNQADVIGRVAVSPFLGGDGPLRRASIGGSGWHGDHVLGPEAPVQATPGGLPFFHARWTLGASTGAAMREQGTVAALGGELNVPIGRSFGLRGEVVWKKQDLTEGTLDATGFSPVGSATLNGISGYGEAWLWLLGDQRLRPPAGLELPFRPTRAAEPSLEDGLMVALRGEVLKEDLNSQTPTLGNPAIATTRVLSGTAGVNYWRGRLIRVSVNYVVDYWSGTSETIQTLIAAGHWEHEVLVRFALAL
jgi:hypothetical protein